MNDLVNIVFIPRLATIIFSNNCIDIDISGLEVRFAVAIVRVTNSNTTHKLESRAHTTYASKNGSTNPKTINKRVGFRTIYECV